MNEEPHGFDLKEPRQIQVRAARPGDLLSCAHVCVRSAQDLDRRQGRPPTPMRPRELLPFMKHVLATDPDGFQVAVSKGKVVCYAITVLRGRTHFLAQFFALPGFQSKGIGRKVLTRAFEAPRTPSDVNRCLTASPDIRAQSLYLKFGTRPQTVIYLFSGEPRKAKGHSRFELEQVGKPGKPTKLALETAAKFDRVLREARRDVDLRFFLTASKGSRFFQAKSGGRVVGYVVVRGSGGIGPAAVEDPSLSGDLLTAAIAKGKELGLKKVVIWVPGINGGAVKAAFTAGLKIDFAAVWMAERPVGNLEAYIPSGGVLF